MASSARAARSDPIARRGQPSAITRSTSPSPSAATASAGRRPRGHPGRRRSAHRAGRHGVLHPGRRSGWLGDSTRHLTGDGRAMSGQDSRRLPAPPTAPRDGSAILRPRLRHREAVVPNLSAASLRRVPQTQRESARPVRRYELMLLFQPDLEDDQLQAAVERVTRAIVNAGGSLSKISPWGKRRLAYPIQHHRDASYFLIHFDIEPSAVHRPRSSPGPASAPGRGRDHRWRSRRSRRRPAPPPEIDEDATSVPHRRPAERRGRDPVQHRRSA